MDHAEHRRDYAERRSVCWNQRESSACIVAEFRGLMLTHWTQEVALRCASNPRHQHFACLSAICASGNVDAKSDPVSSHIYSRFAIPSLWRPSRHPLDGNYSRNCRLVCSGVQQRIPRNHCLQALQRCFHPGGVMNRTELCFSTWARYVVVVASAQAVTLPEIAISALQRGGGVWRAAYSPVACS